MKKNLSESIRQRLKNVSLRKRRPFDEILRYYAIERFLYRLSVSPYARKFFLKGGLMFKVWDVMSHRPTMDIDFLARVSNTLENIHRIISEVATISYEEDALQFETQHLILHKIQTGGVYSGIRASFSTQLFTTKIPLLIDIGFNDLIVPCPQKISYPTLLDLPAPILLGYTMETVIAEKLESIVKLGFINTRMKDFYDLITIINMFEIDQEKLTQAIKKVFSNRETPLQYPDAFSPLFYENSEHQKRWKAFLLAIGKEPIEFKKIIDDLSTSFGFLRDLIT
jgi:predicted nucleotidyltransferase component of viral defense system